MTIFEHSKRVLQAARQRNFLVLVWGLLLCLIITGAVLGQWRISFVAAATLMISVFTLIFESWSGFHLPSTFLWAIILFAVATLVLGEIGDFYERFWWWDMAMHFSSAIAIGIVGVLIVLTLVGGDRLSAPPGLSALLAFCFAVSIGALWEIFEFLMDTLFGLNMQKSGLVDTMSDLMVNALGGAIGALAGYGYLKGKRSRLSKLIMEFVEQNRSRFR